MSPNQILQVDIFTAIGDARRRRILELLSVRERSVGELTAEFQIAQQSVSQHLAVLHTVGLVKQTKRGTSSIYSLERDALAEVIGWIAAL
ncbi:MAG: putative transcriptional regulator [Glaciihabitans sp.]|nr:putative transcriptional regulator [Glaciihabitans sp.]